MEALEHFASIQRSLHDYAQILPIIMPALCAGIIASSLLAIIIVWIIKSYSCYIRFSRKIVLNKSRPEGDFMILFRMCGELWR